MCFFITAIKICYSLIRPLKRTKRFFCRFFKICYKRTQCDRQPIAPAEGAVIWDMMCRFIGYSSQAVN